MTIALYETLFALDSTKVAADTDGVKSALHNNLEKYGAEILVARPWDENGKLAYPIRKQNVTHKKAYFYIIYYKMESTKQADFEGDLRINESLIRQITSRVDPKWAETILDIAKNETGSRFAIKGMADDPSATGEGIISNDPLSRGMGMDGDAPPPPRRSRRMDGPEKPE